MLPAPKRILPFLALILSIHAQRPCPLGQALKDGICELCPPGTFPQRSGRSCIKCPKKTFQPTFGVHIEELCRLCPPNTFSNSEGASSCQPCPEGQRSRHGSKACLKCPPGTVFDEYGDGCTTCNPGAYEEGGECKNCPSGLSSPKRAASVDQCLPCEQLGNCRKCYKDSFRRGNDCVPCPQGLFTRGEGATDPSQCVPCPAGTFYKSLSETCLPCGKGFTSAPGATMCRNPSKPCPKGTFETRDKNCMKCRSGSRFDPEKKICIECGEDRGSPGGLSRGCRKCGPDKVKDQFDGRCKCGSGTFLSKDRTCVKCLPGTSSYAGSNRCIRCSINTFADNRGQEECQSCPHDSVSKRGAKRCTPCPSGQIPPVEEYIGRDHFPMNKCVNATSHCPPGSERVSVSFRTFCRPNICSSGTPVKEIGKTCAPCPKGTFLDETGESPRCKSCRKREVSKGRLQTKCTKCKNGFVRDFRNKSRCSCRGSLAFGKGILDGKCTKCPLGTQSESNPTQTLKDNECKPCTPGTFKPSSQYSVCVRCPIGTFSTGGAVECTPCPPGFVTKRSESTSRRACIRF